MRSPKKYFKQTIDDEITLDLSQDEIAQTQQVLLNPTEVANGAEPIYGSSPNNSWFEDFCF